MLQLARNEDDGSLTIDEIARGEGITPHYAGKLLRILMKGGLVLALLLASVRADAHHSYAAEFDRDSPQTIEGEVVEVWFDPGVATYGELVARALIAPPFIPLFPQIRYRTTEAAEKVAQLHLPLRSTIMVTDLRTAEMIKYASNAFLATKISFINEIANVCEALGADVTEVAAGSGAASVAASSRPGG